MMINHEREPRVLIVDDDASARLMTRATLEQANFLVEEAADGETALKLFDANRHDILLLDVHLPGMNGFTICEKIRETPYGKFTPILMITGVDDIESIENAYKIGATDFIIKPVNWTILGHRVLYLLRARQIFSELQNSRLRLINAKKVAGIADWEWDINNQKLYWSDELFDLLSIPKMGTPLQHEMILNYVDPEDQVFVSNMLKDLFQNHRGFDIEYKVIGEKNRVCHIQEQAKVITDAENRPTSIIGTLQDITNRKLAEAEVKFLAYFDILTGLPNRAQFSEHLEKAIQKAEQQQSQLAVLFLDLDNFKRVNDSLGHNAGDSLLKIVAKRLQNSLRDCDLVSIARLGGDEFIVSLNDDINKDNVDAVARRIINSLNQPVTIECQEVPLSVSVGIAIYPEDGSDTLHLLKNADTAMYHSKDKGKNTFCFYDKKMNELSLDRLRLEHDLQKALEKGEFQVLYQPKIDIKSKQIIGAEALIRWNHPEQGILHPDLFITLAEENNSIQSIGTWVLSQACLATQSWHQAGFSDLHVAVNLSSKQLHNKNMVAIVNEELVRSGIPPHCLELELTEGMIMENRVETLQQLRDLKSLGIKLAVDDFGTGYSSLRYLSQFPIDTLKIDKSFVSKLPHSHSDTTITEAIIALAHSLKLTVVAEGVENEAQYQFLLEHHCDSTQGFYFSKPITAEEMLLKLEGRQEKLLYKTQGFDGVSLLS